MKVVLDETKCLKNKLTLQEALIVAAVSIGNYKATVDNMINRGILNKESPTLTDEWKKVAGKMLDSEDERLTNLATQMRECYPKGKMPGTPFYYRCNIKEIVSKLKKFFEVYGEYEDEAIIDATKKFVAGYQGNYRMMPLIKYFIMKNKKVMDEDGENHISEESPLATILENMSNEEDIPEIDNSEDWLMNSRN